MLPIVPLGHWAYRAFSGIMPEAEQRVFAEADIQAMFIDDIALTARGRFQALVDDLRLFGRDWGFRLADVKAPVRWWHGDADPLVSFEAATVAASYLPEVGLILRPGDPQLWRVLVGHAATVDDAGVLAGRIRADHAQAFVIRDDSL